MKQISEGIFEDRRKLFTLNSSPGLSFFEEYLVNIDGKEYRTWDKLRSKLAAAIVKGLRAIPLKKNSRVLYLGAAHGYTPSFISDIVVNGVVFALDFAPRVVRDLVFVAEKRKNILPIMSDANHPERYYNLVGEVDVVYQDVAQRNQVEIFLKNCEVFLKPGGYGVLALKARSVDVVSDPYKLFTEARKELSRKLEIVEQVNLNPFQKDHTFFVCKKR
jgi:fibrillarin-like pre-rRNA processing protein